VEAIYQRRFPSPLVLYNITTQNLREKPREKVTLAVCVEADDLNVTVIKDQSHALDTTIRNPKNDDGKNSTDYMTIHSSVPCLFPSQICGARDVRAAFSSIKYDWQCIL
jgi:hypothetical protein